jgi:hypothetical protein
MKDIDTFEPAAWARLTAPRAYLEMARYTLARDILRGWPISVAPIPALRSSRTWSALARAVGFLPLYFPSCEQREELF